MDKLEGIAFLNSLQQNKSKIVLILIQNFFNRYYLNNNLNRTSIVNLYSHTPIHPSLSPKPPIHLIQSQNQYLNYFHK